MACDELSRVGGDQGEGDHPHPNRSAEPFGREPFGCELKAERLRVERLTAEALPHQGGGLLGEYKGF